MSPPPPADRPLPSQGGFPMSGTGTLTCLSTVLRVSGSLCRACARAWWSLHRTSDDHGPHTPAAFTCRHGSERPAQSRGRFHLSCSSWASRRSWAALTRARRADCRVVSRSSASARFGLDERHVDPLSTNTTWPAHVAVRAGGRQAGSANRPMFRDSLTTKLVLRPGAGRKKVNRADRRPHRPGHVPGLSLGGRRSLPRGTATAAIAHSARSSSSFSKAAVQPASAPPRPWAG